MVRFIKRLLGIVGYGTPEDFTLAQALGARVETISGRTIARYSSGIVMGMPDDLEYLKRRGLLFPRSEDTGE